MKELDSITKNEFQAYEGVRRSGRLNMWSPQVQALADIDKETHVAIIHFYSELNAKWPDVRLDSYEQEITPPGAGRRGWNKKAPAQGQTP